jgi:hypothetical protein
VRQASSSKEGDERAQDQIPAKRPNKRRRARREVLFMTGLPSSFGFYHHNGNQCPKQNPVSVVF